MIQKEDVSKIVEIILQKLEERKLIKKNNNKNAFEQSVMLLKNYPRLKKSKDKIKKQIKNLEDSKNDYDAFSNPKRDFGEKVQSSKLEINLDSINERIMLLEQDVVIIENYLKFIDNSLSNLPKKDYELIDKYYFQNKNILDLAIDLNCEQSTVYRRVNKIINEKIKVELFPVSYINENN